MTSAVDELRSRGVDNATAIVAASNSTGLPLGVAVGMIMKETGGANIYGHDAGGACCGWGEVTRDNFLGAFLPAVLAGGTSNGVGPTQITYPGYFRQNPDYLWWDPYWNCRFGFELLRGYCGGDYSYGSLVRAGSIYNSGTPTGTAATYGATFADLAVSWTGILAECDTNVAYEEGEDMPSADEIANAILDAQIQRAEMDGTTSLRAETAWLARNFQRIPDDVWGYTVKRAGLPDGDDRAGCDVRVMDILAWQDAMVADVKHAVVEAVRGITGDETITDAVSKAIDRYIQYERTEPGTVPAAPLDATVHVIRRGETLKAIAEAAGRTVADLVTLNPGLEPNSITAGQKVRTA